MLGPWWKSHAEHPTGGCSNLHIEDPMHTTAPTRPPGISCTRIQLCADVHDMSVCMPVLADAGEPGPRDRGRAYRGTAGSEYRSMAGPSGEFGEVAGNPIKLGSAGEPG